jgi:hypothetical protein
VRAGYDASVDGVHRGMPTLLGIMQITLTHCPRRYSELPSIFNFGEALR